MKIAGYRKASAALILSLLVFGVLFLIATFPSIFQAKPTDHQIEVASNSSTSGAYFNHMVVILMENKGYCEIITTCGGTSTYETQLAQQYSITGSCQTDSSCSIGGYTAITHPSEPNYVALFSGSTQGLSSDGVCCYQYGAKNLVDLFQGAGLSWKAYAEGATNNETCNFMPPRAGDHFPFLDFSDMNTPSRCANLISTTASNDGTAASGDSSFLSALNTPSGWANFYWLTPNDNDNGHDTGAAYADSWLSIIVPQILNSAMFKNSRSLLYITYDEGNGNYPNDYISTILAGPVVKQGYVGSQSYSHYSFLSTLEANWGLTSLTSNDGGANAMTEFFSSALATTSSSIQTSSVSTTTTPPSTTTATTTSSTSSSVAGSPTITTESSFPNGAAFSGIYVEVQSGGTTIASGFTPLSFNTTPGVAYEISVYYSPPYSYGNVFFDYWNTGSTRSSITVAPTSTTTYTAYYSEASSSSSTTTAATTTSSSTTTTIPTTSTTTTISTTTTQPHPPPTTTTFTTTIHATTTSTTSTTSVTSAQSSTTSRATSTSTSTTVQTSRSSTNSNTHTITSSKSSSTSSKTSKATTSSTSPTTASTASSNAVTAQSTNQTTSSSYTSTISHSQSFHSGSSSASSTVSSELRQSSNGLELFLAVAIVVMISVGSIVAILRRRKH